MVHVRKLKFEQHDPICSTSGIDDAADANNRSYVTHGDKSRATTNEITGNQYKPNISMFIREMFSIKDKKIHEGDH